MFCSPYFGSTITRHITQQYCYLFCKHPERLTRHIHVPRVLTWLVWGFVEGEVLNVGRKTRVIPTAIRRALRARDRSCQYPGCSQSRYVDGHHIVHWADGGETKLNNLVLIVGDITDWCTSSVIKS
ncbi:MAG: HNH endonuclease [Gammaproteobacteria bacterium]|nr:MAG: HNH endonuclease [Gammaproteobacteria bacterium]TDJ39515.1 MAG: HNH endonuclease [Gammaproteobacteria bacterium]